MAKSVRSLAIELHENAKAIEAWRATLPERQRRRLVHPLSNVRRWRAATTHNGKCPQDFKRDAIAAWRRFVSCVDCCRPIRPRRYGKPHRRRRPYPWERSRDVSSTKNTRIDDAGGATWSYAGSAILTMATLFRSGVHPFS